MLSLKLENLVATEKAGELLGRLVEAGDVLLLTGDLGAGKTTFTQSLARGLGIAQHVKSPTYTLIREYQSGRIPLYHMDVYRMAGAEDDLGLEEYFEGDGVTVMEWGRILEDELPADFLEIILEKIPGTSEGRYLKFVATGERSRKLANQWIENARKEGIGYE